MNRQIKRFSEGEIEWIKQFSAVVTDGIFLMKVKKEQTAHLFIYEYMNKPAMELARLSRRDIGSKLRDSNSIGHAQFLREHYLRVLETNDIVTYKDNVMLPNGQYEARTQLIPVYNIGNEITYIVGVTVNVTQLSEKSDDVKYLNRLFSTYMDTTDNGVAMIDFTGRFLVTNESFIRLFGYTKGELLNLKLEEFQPQLKDKFTRFCQLLKKGEKIHNLTLELTKKSAEILYTTISFTPIPNEHQEFVAFAVIIHNITDEIETKRKLTATQDRYRLIAEHTQDLVNIIDANGIITYASPSHLPTLGYDPASLVGNWVLNHVHEDDKKELGKILAKTKKVKKSLLTEFRIIKKSGRAIWVESNIKPVKNKDGSLRQIVTASRDITNRVKAEEKLKRLALTDYLTGLPNKREFINELTSEKKKIDNGISKYMAVCYIDGDEFKKINDECGHDIGDKFLIKIGERLKETIPLGNFVARIGGDEFAVLLKKIDGAEEAVIIAKSIISRMSSPVKIDDYTFTNTLSIGISIYPTDDTDIDGILLKADQALYEAKKNGKNTYCSYA
ncbi:hypothetical protein CFK37_16590 [Virgibacillus phasianinus]|uniref:Diguanylate cyclase n=1 Tax=Virgibacillus phasianinus TaxID=2017483 RepID=A0A220U6A5_9BACI|nr:diguanylate cyclase [Virgibacillus phasianinus]ASK63659.1 hypothetical protein CFK37_16590 [Virgibacillus phasianinus]